MSSQKLHISDTLSLPIEAVTDTFAILAVRGVGKTHTASVMAEEMLKAGQPIVAYDPTGAWWGLKSSASGKRAGFPVVVFGGEHADVPLEPSAGATIATTIVEKRIPAILDCLLMRKGERVRFMTDFCETLYHKNRDALHLFLDEAHTVAPQNVTRMPEAARLLGAVEDIVLQGRRRGLGMTAISQRPALLNTNVRSQCMTLIAMRIFGKHDRKAIDEWIEAHGDPDKAKAMLADLPALPKGDAWVWNAAAEIFKRVHFRARETFDSSATPEVGGKIVGPQRMADIDLDALGQAIKATVEKAKADDPKVLRARIAELEKKMIAQKPIDPQTLKTEYLRGMATAEGMTISTLKGIAERIDYIRKDAQKYERQLTQMIEEANSAVANLKEKGFSHYQPKGEKPVAPPRDNGQIPNHFSNTRCTDKPISSPAANGHPGTIGKSGLRRILTALAQKNGLTNRQIGTRSGLSSNSGTFGTYMAKARSEGWIRDEGDRRFITESGIAALGDYEPLPTGRDLLNYWLSELGDSGASRILRAVANAYPESLTNDQIGEAARISPASGTFGTYMAKLRSLELISSERGCTTASEEFFE